jgi:hypothetical protein
VKGVRVELHLLDDWAWARQPLVEELPTGDLMQYEVRYRLGVSLSNDAKTATKTATKAC